MHRIWNDNECTYVITGRLGARKLAIRNKNIQKQTSIEDCIIPSDVLFVENFQNDSIFGFKVFIAGRLVTVKDPTTPDVQFFENPYVKSANILALLGRFIGETDDEEIIQTIIGIIGKDKNILN